MPQFTRETSIHLRQALSLFTHHHSVALRTRALKITTSVNAALTNCVHHFLSRPHLTTTVPAGALTGKTGPYGPAAAQLPRPDDNTVRIGRHAH